MSHVVRIEALGTSPNPSIFSEYYVLGALFNPWKATHEHVIVTDEEVVIDLKLLGHQKSQLVATKNWAVIFK